MSWDFVTLDKLGEISRGKSKHRPRNDSSLFGGKYPFIQTADIKAAGMYLTKYSETYNDRGLAQSKIWPKGTLCITIAANIADTTILGIDACFPDSVMGFIPFEDVANVKFVKYSFDILQRDCKNISQGTAQDNLSWKKLSTIKFPMPSIDLQNKIVDILSAYDDLIENNQKQIKLLEEAAQRLYKEWFIDLRFPGHENVEIVNGIPVEWEYLEFLNIAPIITGKKDANFGSENGKYLFFTCSQQPLLAESYSYDCDAVILAGNGDFNVKLYRGKFEAYQRTYVLSPYKTEHLYLLFYTIKNRMNYLIQGASGSTIKFLTKGMIADIKVLVPTCEILDQYNEIAEPLQRKLEVLIYQNKLLTEARDRLLPKLMSGETEV
ncbi:MAG: restriction endonuclease subunit S [Veillonella dispar]|nr:restriction endonuclease subunit S [Veillonella dispar]